jgi:hypothetical protein
MRSVLALAAVAAFASWSGSAEAFGKKNKCSGNGRGCSGYNGGYGYGGCSGYHGGYGSGYGCSGYHGGYGSGCSATVVQSAPVAVAPAPVVAAPAAPVATVVTGCSGYHGGYSGYGGCSGYHGGYGYGDGCSNGWGNGCGGKKKNKSRKCCR